MSGERNTHCSHLFGNIRRLCTLTPAPKTKTKRTLTYISEHTGTTQDSSQEAEASALAKGVYYTHRNMTKANPPSPLFFCSPILSSRGKRPGHHAYRRTRAAYARCPCGRLLPTKRKRAPVFPRAIHFSLRFCRHGQSRAGLAAHVVSIRSPSTHTALGLFCLFKLHDV